MSDTVRQIEDLDNKFDAAIELLVQLKDDMKTLVLKEDIDHLKVNLETINATLRDTNKDVLPQEQRQQS